MKQYKFDYNVPKDYTLNGVFIIMLPIEVTKLQDRYHVMIKGQISLSQISLIESWNQIEKDCIELAKPYLDETETV